MTTIILAVTAFLTSILSGIIGMGGGVLLLAVLLSFMPHAEAIPTHAAVQLFSNGTRVVIGLKSVHWPSFNRFLLGVIPGSAIGIGILVTIGTPDDGEPYLRILIGAFILAVTYVRPREGAGLLPERWKFFVIGVLAGAASLTVGAVGQLVAPAFTQGRFEKEQVIATKATCQMLTHILKIPAFIIVQRVDPISLGAAAMLMIVMVIPGTMIGQRILRRVREEHFRKIYLAAVTLAGIKILLWDGVWGVIQRAI